MTRKVSDTVGGKSSVVAATGKSPQQTAHVLRPGETLPSVPTNFSDSDKVRITSQGVDPREMERVSRKWTGKPPPIDRRERKARSETADAAEISGGTADPHFTLGAIAWKKSGLLADDLEPFRQAADRAAKLHIGSGHLVEFQFAAEAIAETFLWVESIDSAKVAAAAQQELRRALERMDEQERKRTIAGLMAYIGELQTSGVLESVPSDRLARVAKLIGEAAEIVSADPSTFIPLFRDREVDPSTGKKPTALEWFDAVWKPRVEAGEASGDDIRGVDPAFYNNFAAALSKRGEKVRDYLPPSPTRGKKDETAEQRAERLRRHSRESKRRARQQRSDPRT